MMMKILKLKIHNFKIYADKVFDFSDCDDVIFYGRNGFGKTSIFDALELLFTGKIRRYEIYAKEFHDQQLHIHGKQLVHDKNVSDIYVEAIIQLKGGGNIKLKVSGKTKDMTPPIQFDVIFKREIEGNLENKDFQKQYNRLNYLSQDESTEYIKCKESERSKKIADLFKTENFDNQINKIDVAIGGLNNLIKDYSNGLDKIHAAKDALNAKINQLNDVNKNIVNVRLFKNDTIAWDCDKFEASPNDIDELLKENGAINQILFFVNHEQDYQAYQWNRRINQSMQQDTLHKIAFFYKYKSKAHLFGLYDTYKATYLKQYSELTIDNLSARSISFVDSLSTIIKWEDIDRLEKWHIEASRMLVSSSKVAQACNKILESRRRLSIDLKDTDITNCPVCGTSFKSKDLLQQHIDKYEKVFLEEAMRMGKVPATVLSDFREVFLKSVIGPINQYFNQNDITDEIYSEYKRIKNIGETDSYKLTISLIGDDDIKTSLSLMDIERNISSRLIAKKKKANENLDYTLLQHCATRYGQYLLDDINKETIMKKRNYLQQFQWQLCVEGSKKNTVEETRLNELIAKSHRYLSKLKTIKNDIKAQKEEYINNVISDIQILFYIYSGRIMQDSYYGRGVFLKRIVSGSNIPRIIFVTGSYDSDVDVLLNMSSGQLISVAIAFFLALNKLYDDEGFLAIDDPVQTIDDINLWGLIETLRHEFGNKTLLLSTHENDSAALIRYKLSMVGRNAYALNMSTINHNDTKGGNNE